MDLAPVQEKGKNVKRPREFGESVFRGSFRQNFGRGSTDMRGSDVKGRSGIPFFKTTSSWKCFPFETAVPGRKGEQTLLKGFEYRKMGGGCHKQNLDGFASVTALVWSSRGFSHGG